MQVFLDVCVLFYSYNNNVFFFASVCFLLTSDSFFLYVISYCLLAQFLSHHRRRRKTSGGKRVIRVFACFGKEKRGIGGRMSRGIIIQIESFAILSLRVPLFLFRSVRFVLTTYSI